MRALRSLLALAAATPLASLGAQAPDSTRADTTRLDAVVVTATRLATPLRDVPASVTVLAGDDLRARGVRWVLDALREVPNAALVQGGSFGAQTSLFLRGGESDYVKVLVDGVPVNDPGGSVNLAHLTTDNVERIEVVRGPASVLYGSDAVTGVVQIFTRAGAGRPAVRGSLLGGSYGTTRWDVGAHGGGERMRWSADVARSATDGVLDVNNRYTNLVGSARVAVRPDARTDVALALRAGDARYAFPTNSAGAIADSNQFTTDRGVTVSLDAGRRLSSRVEARLQAGVWDAARDFDDRPDSPGDTVGFGYASRRDGDVARRLVDGRVNVDAGPAVLTAGVTVEREEERQTSRTLSNLGDLGGSTETTGAFAADRGNVGYYAQAVVRLPAALTLTAGARLDDNEVFGTFDTWRAGLAWTLPTATRLRVSGGTAFKAPTFAEQFAASAFEVGNPALEPERSTSWEAGVEQELLAGRVTLGATAFAQRFRDLIQYSFTSPDAPSYFNVARARADGLEAEARVHATRALELGLSASWLVTEVQDAGFSTEPGAAFVDGARLIRRPARSATASARWTRGERAALGAVLTYVGARDDVDFREFPSVRTTLPGYALLDVSADVELLPERARRPRLALALRAENVLDREYEAVVGFPGRGRVLLAGLRVGR